MKKCPNCGTENNSNAKFCIHCGYRFSMVQSSRRTAVQPGIIRCPNCGKANSSHSKFCRYCGHKLVKPIHRPVGNYVNPTRRNYQYPHHAPRTNQSLSKVNNYLRDYYLWFKKTLINPLSSKTGQPYFGAISFGITIVFLWVAEILSRNSSEIFNQVTSIFGYLPINSYFDIFTKADFKSPVWLLVLTIITILIYWLVAFVSCVITTKNHAHIADVGNQLASVTNVTTLFSFLAIIGTLMNGTILVWLFILFTKIIFVTGTFYVVFLSTKVNKNGSKIYIATLACIVSYILQGVIMVLVGMLMP